jgi:hypothetical protein
MVSEPEVASQPMDGQEVLERLAALPISTWRYHWEDPGIRHLGPMSQDFMEAFGLDSDDRMINLLDASGVTMVSIQALYRRLERLTARVSELEARLKDGSSFAAGRTADQG